VCVCVLIVKELNKNKLLIVFLMFFSRFNPNMII
jgi:hypothetical protein